MRILSLQISVVLITVLTGCQTMPDQTASLSPFHLQAGSTTEIPPAPRPAARTTNHEQPLLPSTSEKYNVAVQNVPVQELLFALVRESAINVDIHPDISGRVTLNAAAQTLPQLLNRIARQVAVRWEIVDSSIIVVPDIPYLQHYRVDYVNLSRESTGTLSVSSHMGSSSGSSSDNGTSNDGNHSLTRIENRGSNHFWGTLVDNIKSLLADTDETEDFAGEEVNSLPANFAALVGQTEESTTKGDESKKILPEAKEIKSVKPNEKNPSKIRTGQGGKGGKSSVVAHPESGVISVRATARQHARVRSLIDQIVGSARRQVLVEATIVEIQLNHNFEQGVDWSRISLDGTGLTFIQSATGNISAPPSSLIQIGYVNPTSAVGDITAAIRLLESFGTVKVLSSPKISVLNNQTAVLKVVDNQIYFTLNTDVSQNQNTTLTTFTSNLHSVPVGFVMSVTAQVSEDDSVLLMVRPSISRIIGYVSDPNPALKSADAVSEIPIIRSREMESMMSIANGNIMVMGGLMEDVLADRDNRVPVLGHIPVLGELFTHRNDTSSKSELIVLLRPTVTAGYGGKSAYSPDMDSWLPQKDFFSSEMSDRSPLMSEDVDQP